MFIDALEGIRSYNNSFVLAIIIFIIIFEFFFEIPSLKKSGLKKDAKVATILNIGLVLATFAFLIIGRKY